VWSFGWNAYGQLGDGTTTNRTTPVRVTAATGGSALTGATQVSAGAHHSYALLADGSVRSWGRNYRAELGDGTKTNRTRAVQVQGVTGAVSIGSGRDSGEAVLSDGTVKAWGHNAYGQLGDGTTTNRTSAVTVRGVSGATTAGGGGSEYLTVLVGS
jgi:alpha-tubulin suppressor-like RCC1 family protein